MRVSSVERPHPPRAVRRGPVTRATGQGGMPERPVWKIVYVAFIAGLLLLGVALVVVFTVWFISDPNAPVF
jgi:hypothetical protein